MRISTTAVMAFVLLTANFALAADPDSPVFTDSEKAGIDFALQGEYLGEVETKDGKKKIGVQVLALGDGKFRVAGYVGGLPGDGWSRSDEIHTKEGELNGDSVTFVSDDEAIKSVLTNGRNTVFKEGNELCQLAKITRKSPTLGAKPPENAIVLFDGQNTDAWENGKIVEGKYLATTDVFTKEKFGDHSFHIEFRTPFMPKSTG